MHRADPKDHYDFDDVAELRKLAARPDPVYPSARVTIAPSGNYMEAVEALLGVERVRCDGDTFLVPEFEKDAIEMLRTRFGGEVELGCGEEWEFSTKAGLEGVSDRFIRLGTATNNNGANRRRNARCSDSPA